MRLELPNVLRVVCLETIRMAEGFFRELSAIIQYHVVIESF